MDVVDVIYYIFILCSLFFTSFFLLLFLTARNKIWREKLAEHPKSLTVLVPAFNEEKSIAGTLEHIMSANFPRNLLEVLVLNDGSTDRTREIAQAFADKYPRNIKVINKPNSGKADSLNFGIKKAKGFYIAVVDADSYPSRDAFLLMQGFFEREEGVGGVTANIKIRKIGNFIQKLQDLEYTTIVWVRKLLQYVDGIYATPGPLSMYTKEAIEKIGGFDTKNMTEDIEIAWRLLYHRYKIRMSLNSEVTTEAPTTFKKWWNQRVRWGLGGVQTTLKYRRTFLRKNYGTLGIFVAPFFVLSYALTHTGFTVMLYRIFGETIYGAYYSLSTGYWGVGKGVANFVNLPNSFTFFLLLLLIMTIFYVGFAFRSMGNTNYFNIRKGGFLVVAFYLTVYVLMTPIILLAVLYRLVRGNYKWWG